MRQGFLYMELFGSLELLHVVTEIRLDCLVLGGELDEEDEDDEVEEDDDQEEASDDEADKEPFFKRSTLWVRLSDLDEEPVATKLALTGLNAEFKLGICCFWDCWCGGTTSEKADDFLVPLLLVG